ncbi:serine hydrolase domain-containing protein [Streptomyces gilvosporeus]|uniref:EstA family serine hydrolase n=1 Tax=Streptomyces gilvosporeus TaxID=553510 RepID=A0A1V0TJL0_9ACTN|nr:serine hydrolase domain-containing protein [Streptomyces gilvosporeus]ARF53115.1 EstA family serine hydrolase [Streptomyces gilvosporeus]
MAGGDNQVHGTVTEGFEGVREAFAAVLDEARDAPEAQLVVHVDGRRVVDLWGGPGTTADTLTGVYSLTKGAAHLVVALLVQDGVLDLDREVAAYWPEFGAEGKEQLTLRELLAHRSGVVGVDGGFTTGELADDRLMAARLAGQRPFWEPGTAYGYHAFVIGALTGEVVRRVTGRSIHEIYEERIRAPYGLDFHLGLPEALEARYADVLPLLPTPQEAEQLAANAAAPDSVRAVAFNQNATTPTDLVAFANTRAVRALGPTSSGGVGTARGVAGMYAAAISEVDGRAPLLKPETVTKFARVHYRGTDLVTGIEDAFGLGFEGLSGRYPFLGPDTFGHSGATGSLGFADPDSGVAYAYTRRRFGFPTGVGAALENHRLAEAAVRAAGGR